jgi:tetratricopeptide (TPR) repeat protein
MTLEEATRALREDGAMAVARKRALRDRVLGAPRKRSLRAARWVMPIAAVLAAASVWASVTREHHVSAPVVAPIAPIATIATTAVVAPVIVTTASVTVIESAPASVAPPVHVAAATNSPPPDDSERRALRAYREAERLQFDEKDYARALEAWDRYVPLAGKSPLLVDAKWQRALCLVRLGRSDEARSALEPFAHGDLGAYRQSEAQTILGTLR